jgi:hypothetical protein
MLLDSAGPISHASEVVRRQSLALLLLGATFVTRPAFAQDLRSKVVLEMERVEDQIKTTRWNLNTLEQKRGLEEQLRLLRRLYDRILVHESEFMTMECAGATVQPEGGPPVSDATSDAIGSLSQEEASRQLLGGGGGMGGGGGGHGAVPGPEPNGLPTAPPGTIAGMSMHLIFARQITDTEVRLLAQLVYIEDRLDKGPWHLNNLDEQKSLKAERERVRSALRRLRNSRC